MDWLIPSPPERTLENLLFLIGILGVILGLIVLFLLAGKDEGSWAAREIKQRDIHH